MSSSLQSTLSNAKVISTCDDIAVFFLALSPGSVRLWVHVGKNFIL